MEKKKDRKFILYIVIIVFIASLGTLTYRVGSSIKAKKDAIIEEFNKEKQEIKDKQKKAEEEAKKRQEELEQKRKEEELEREKDSFNNMHEFYAGTKGGTATGLEVDEIIKSNKKSSDHLIEVIFDGTSYGTEPDKIKDELTKDQYKLYKLIYNRFLASQMAPAVFNTISATIDANNYTFKANGQSIKFKGFMALYVEGVDVESKEDNSNVPDLKEKQEVKKESIEGKQSFTEPPPRYTEASLVKAL